MTSLTDKMPVKDFNAIFKNDELAKEISQLIEKAKKPPKIEYRYTKEELLEIGKNPICRVPKAIFNARLSEANISDNIIYSLQRKSSLDKSQNISNSQENVNDNFDESSHNYSRYKNNSTRNLKTRENTESYRENASNPRYEKNYRLNKISDSEAAQCWRTDKNLSNNNNNRTKREYQDRYAQSRKLPYNSKYSRNGYRDDYEEEPEWFSNGPESMNEFIDLRGFDDDENGLDGNQEFTGRRNSENFSTSDSGDTQDTSKNQSFSRNLSDLSSMLNMNVSDFFNSPNVSFLENKDINDFPLPLFGELNSSNTSSRAEKWFKSKKDSSSAEDSIQNVSKSTSSPLAASNEKSNSIMNLFQNAKKLSQSSANIADIKVDMSKATSLAELEANLFNSSAPQRKHENGPSKDSAVLSKLFSLAGQQEAKSKIQNNMNPSQQYQPFNTLHGFGSEPSHKQLNEHNMMPERPNNAPMFPNDFMQMPAQGMNRMVHPSFLKGAPMPPFPFPDNVPFNMESMHQQRPPFFPAIPPELAQQFIPPNAFVPGFMPNAPFPPMMNQQGPIPPLLSAQLLAYYNGMRQAPLMPQDLARPKNEEPNLTDKLLKNSKFTPTSVFRKLTDQNKAKLSSKVDSHSILPTKSEIDILNSAARPSDPFELNKETRTFFANHHPSNTRMNPTTMPPSSLSNFSQTNDTNADMNRLFQQLQMNRVPPNHAPTEAKPNSISLTPNDIFSVMKKNEHDTSNIDLPPLPMKNALKLEDLENF